MGVRSQGLLQTWELQAFDTLMRSLSVASAVSRPQEKPDPRILVVTVTETDVRSRLLFASYMDYALAY